MLRAVFSIVLLLTSFSQADSIRVSAAISLKSPLQEIAAGYEKESNTHIELNLGASGQLGAQIRGGAPVDLFLSASAAEVDKIADFVDPASRRVIARNRLVLIIPKSAKWTDGGFSQLADSNIKRIAIGQPKTVPAGQYAQQALAKLNLLEKVETKLVYGANVRQVLDYVERSEVDAGIVYSTDALESGDKVKVVTFADESLHAPIEYVGAVVKDSAKRQAAAAFLKYLTSPASQQIFQHHGFGVVDLATTKATSP